jgi:adenylate cyclase
MANEIERKFLVEVNDDFRDILRDRKPLVIKQGYIDLKVPSVEIKRLELGGLITIYLKDKSYSYHIPEKDYEELLNFCENSFFISSKNNQIVRIRTMNESAFLTIKGKQIVITKPEYEYEIPYDDAIELFSACNNFVSKERFKYFYMTFVFEIDVFKDLNEGLILTEVELSNENVKIPTFSWLKNDVSLDFKYSNNNLGLNPFTKW